MTLAPPALGESYSLTELPRIPGLPLTDRVVVPESQREKDMLATDTIDLGISKLIVLSYVLKPTPKLVWLHPLSPNTSVDAMDVRYGLYAIATTERRKSKLQLIQRTDNETVVAQGATLPSAAASVRFAAGNSIYVLLKTGELLLARYDADKQTVSAPQSILESSARNTVVFHTYITGHSFKHKNDLLFYVSFRGDEFAYQLIALDEDRSFEIYHRSSPCSSYKDTRVFAYSDGTVYSLLCTTCVLSSSSLMQPQQTIKTLSLTDLIGEPAPASFAMIAVAPERLLVSHRSLVYLVNFKFGSLLSEHTNNSGNSVHMCFALPVAGDSAQTRNSFALYLNLEEKSNICKLKLIQVDVGLNLLIESIGKSLAPPKQQSWAGLPHLDENNLVKANSTGANKLRKVFNALTTAKENGSGDAFDSKLITFLRTGEKESASLRYSSLDRVVDDAFIALVLSLIFQFDETKSLQVIDESFLPEKSLAYLLTHPLFPAEYTSGLLMLLSALEQPELLKLAILRCPSLTVDELVTEFMNLTEVSEEVEEEGQGEYVMEFLRATIDRMVRDFSMAQITSHLLEALNSEYEGASKKLERMLNVLINVNSNNSWTLVQAVIDVGGLFNWNVPTISALSDVIDAKVDALMQNSYNLTLTNQAVLGVEHKSRSKLKRKSNKDNIYEVTHRKQQLDAILTMSNNTDNKKLLVDEGLELAKQIPVYSRERLVL